MNKKDRPQFYITCETRLVYEVEGHTLCKTYKIQMPLVLTTHYVKLKIQGGL